jgi:hypothetical protein
MSQIGPCPAARVTRAGRYEISLRHGGRFALIAAPGRGNIVSLTPRWVSVPAGRTTTLNIDGGNMEK